MVAQGRGFLEGADSASRWKDLMVIWEYQWGLKEDGEKSIQSCLDIISRSGFVEEFEEDIGRMTDFKRR